MHKAGSDDSIIWAWLDRSNVAVESVSKLKGRKIKVSGSSFTTSINTSKPALINVDLINGRFTEVNEVYADDPNVFDAWFNESQFVSMAALIGCHATVK